MNSTLGYLKHSPFKATRSETQKLGDCDQSMHINNIETQLILTLYAVDVGCSHESVHFFPPDVISL